MTKAQQQEREEARERLREILKPGDTVWTVLRSMSRSGMSRSIDAYKLTAQPDGSTDRLWLSRLVARAGIGSWDNKREAVRMGGCGMDMGFALVYELSHALWPKGYGCTGEKCRSNDHSNGDRDYTPHGHRKAVHVPNDPDALKHWHTDGGYALEHRWL